MVPTSRIFHDSKVRLEPKNYLFSKSYYKNEVKDLQLDFGDINKDASNSSIDIIIPEGVIISGNIAGQTIRLRSSGCSIHES